MRIKPEYSYAEVARMKGRGKRTIENMVYNGHLEGAGGRVSLAAVKRHFGLSTAELRELDVPMDDELDPVPAA